MPQVCRSRRNVAQEREGVRAGEGSTGPPGPSRPLPVQVRKCEGPIEHACQSQSKVEATLPLLLSGSTKQSGQTV